MPNALGCWNNLKKSFPDRLTYFINSQLVCCLFRNVFRYYTNVNFDQFQKSWKKTTNNPIWKNNYVDGIYYSKWPAKKNRTMSRCFSRNPIGINFWSTAWNARNPIPYYKGRFILFLLLCLVLESRLPSTRPRLIITSRKVLKAPFIIVEINEIFTNKKIPQEPNLNE